MEKHARPRTELEMTSNPLEFRADEAALVVIDTQEKWVPMIPNRHLVVANMRTLIKLARCFEMPIVVAEHLPWVIGETVKELRELLDPKTPVIKKTVYNISTIRASPRRSSTPGASSSCSAGSRLTSVWDFLRWRRCGAATRFSWRRIARGLRRRSIATPRSNGSGKRASCPPPGTP